MSEETRVTDPNTGGQKGDKLERYDLIPVGPLAEVARHYGVGARKYEDRNWEKGYRWSLSYAALQRHANAFWSGESIDPENGQMHLAAVAFHAFALMEWETTHPELDDRPNTTNLEEANLEEAYREGWVDAMHQENVPDEPVRQGGYAKDEHDRAWSFDPRDTANTPASTFDERPA